MGLFDRFKKEKPAKNNHVPHQHHSGQGPGKPVSGPGDTVRTTSVSRLPGLESVKHIVAVASGKGGVGKSTVSANLGLSMVKKGLKVGLLDADIYGPSQGTLFGHKGERPKNHNGQIQPLESHGLKYISMSSVLGDDAPVIWRAPMATKAVSQFLNVAWGELDVLLVDLPPGTGDIQITLAQQASLSGAIIVSTPQHVAANIAKKGLEMFRQVNIPIVGIIENMSGYTCESCGHTSHIFSDGGGEKLAKSVDVPFLGRIPLDPKVMEASDLGEPSVLKYPEAEGARSFVAATDKMVEELKRLENEVDTYQPEVAKIDEDGSLLVKWRDGFTVNLPAYDLRLSCPCASCVDENTGQRILDPKTIPMDIRVSNIRPVGRYGMSLNYTYPHDTGIFKFPRLRQLAEEKGQSESFTV